ncbi:MAG: hypothetical protein E6268_10180, partial [Veillonella sp.]|nr:hypothetical protein [Veillonella sp.]
MEEKQWKGMGLAIMGALFWGLSGTSVQFLENAKLKSHLYLNCTPKIGHNFWRCSFSMSKYSQKTKDQALYLF